MTTDALDISGSLRGQRIFLTGGTGFIGKVLIEKLLWSIPDVGKLVVLVRAGDQAAAVERVERKVFESPIMARLRALHGDAWRSWVNGKVDVVAGDLGQDRFGLDPESYGALCRNVDRVVASAATVTFDERLDRALELNARGALRTLALARDAGDVPLVHVSTCFVSGRRTGWIDEGLPELKPGAGDIDLDGAMAALEQACLDAGRGPSEVGSYDTALIAAGTAQAERFGFHDVYTMTKALGELLLARERGGVPVTIVRPAIVESAAWGPIPGWLEAIRVSDPLLVAYGRGRTREIPGAAGVPLELVPVDIVVHALIAALAELHAGDGSGEPRIYQVGSSRHPITLGRLMSLAREGFARTPLRDPGGSPISVDEARFVEPARLRAELSRRRRRLKALSRLSAAARSTRFAERLKVADRTLEHFERLVDVYRPYLREGARYRDDATQALWRRLAPDDRAAFPFDIADLDWRSYIERVHVPGLVRFALKADIGAPAAPPPEVSRVDRHSEAEAHAARAGTLFELFAHVADANPEDVFLQTCRDGNWLRYTYGEALATVANLAWGLATRHGIASGDRVVLWAGGGPEWVLATLAIHRLGATAVPLDPQWPVVEIGQAARLVAAKLLCAAPTLLAATPLDRAAAGCPVVSLAEPFVPAPDVGLLPGAEAIPPAGGPEDVACILFTSGTTVAPKAVPLTHANYLANVRDLVPLMRLSRDRLLSVLPIHHAFEQMVGLLVPMAGASTISYVSKVEPAEISWMMATTRPTGLVAVPRLLELLHGGIFRSVEAGGPLLGLVFKVLFGLSRLTGARLGARLFGKVHRRFGGSLRRIATGGTALEPSLGRSFQLMGFQVAEGYGMTETSPVLTVNPWDDLRFGSAGRPLPGVEVELRPPRDAIGVEPGSGEIWVRGANVMSGYFRNPEATDKVMREGWLDTGDIGRFDDGFLYLSGRSKDVIVTDAGKNVYPEEVEGRYRGLPEVQELIVLGLPRGDDDGSAGGSEQVAAVIVPRPGASEDEVEGIRSAVAARSTEVPSYQRITRVEIWRGELPKTTTMKVKRGLLKDAILAGERGAGHAAAPASKAARKPLDAGEAWVIDTLARLTHARADQLRPSDRLSELGVDSLTRVELAGAFEPRFGRRLGDSTLASLDRVRDLFDRI